MFIETPANKTDKRGWIEVITGSMFSGKTEELIRRLRRAKIAMQEVEIFKPRVDVRYSEDEVVSHDENAIRSTPVSSSGNILLLANDVHTIGVDEAQFFDMGLIEVCNSLANKGIRGGNLAHHTHRIGKADKLVLLGEKDLYEPLCRKCYNVARTE